MTRRRKQPRGDHAHVYRPHPTWDTHAACRLCGLAIHRDHLAYALDHGASYEPEERQP